MDKEIEEFCTYLAKVYVRLLRKGIPAPNVNCWMAQSITMFYMQKETNINLEFKKIMDGEISDRNVLIGRLTLALITCRNVLSDPKLERLVRTEGGAELYKDCANACEVANLAMQNKDADGKTARS